MILTLIFASLVQSSLASGPCGGAQVGFWTNPDQSRGGSVATTAKVQAGAFIASGAQVCESAQVKAGAKILDQAIVSGRAVINSGAEISGKAKVQGEAKIGGSNVATKIGGEALVEGSAMVTGNTQVIARAKVRGSSKVHNAIICQASLIEGFDVIDSDYYCQTEDPEPAHPGELGKKTLLGVDSDRDGVRDDVEIWINDTYSNEPSREKTILREYSKELTKELNMVMKFKDDSLKFGSHVNTMQNLTDCVPYNSSRDEKEVHELVAVFFNTESRFSVFSKTQKKYSKTPVKLGLERDRDCSKFNYFKKSKKIK